MNIANIFICFWTMLSSGIISFYSRRIVYSLLFKSNSQNDLTEVFIFFFFLPFFNGYSMTEKEVTEVWVNSSRMDRIGHKDMICSHCSWWAHFNIFSICTAQKHQNNLRLFPKVVQVLRRSNSVALNVNNERLNISRSFHMLMVQKPKLQ